MATRAETVSAPTRTASARAWKGLARIPLYLILILVALLTVFPFYWMVVGSFMKPVELFSTVPKLLPSALDTSAYKRMFQLVPISRYFLNSVIVSTTTMVVSVLASSAAGYCFAHLHFVGKRFWFVLTLATLMVPYHARIVPLFVMFTNYGLKNTYLGIVLPGLVSAFGVFMMTQFFRTLPHELREAAIVDGAGELRIFFQIFLPLARPAVVTLALIVFLQSWDDLLWPMIIAPQPEMRTLQVGLAFIKQTAMSPNQTMAAIVLAVIPVLVVFLVAQRQFISGITAGAVKG